MPAQGGAEGQAGRTGEEELGELGELGSAPRVWARTEPSSHPERLRKGQTPIFGFIINVGRWCWAAGNRAGK